MTILKKAMSLAGRTLIRIIKHPIGRWILIAVVLLLMLSIFLAIYQPSHRFSTTLEAGSPLPNPVDLTDRIDAVYLNAGDYDPTVPGVYRMTIRAGGGTYYLKVAVEDTVPPVGTVRPLNWGLGTVMPDASEFFTQIVDATAVTASYLNQNVYGAMGTYPVELLLRDAAGN